MKKRWIIGRALVVFAALTVLVLAGVFYTALASGDEDTYHTPTEANGSFFHVSGVTLFGEDVKGAYTDKKIYFVDGDQIRFTLTPGSTEGLGSIKEVYCESNFFSNVKDGDAAENNGNIVVTIDLAKLSGTAETNKYVRGTAVYYNSENETYTRKGFYIPLENNKIPVSLQIADLSQVPDVFEQRVYDGTTAVKQKDGQTLGLVVNANHLLPADRNNERVVLSGASDATYKLNSPNVDKSDTLLVDGLRLEGTSGERYEIDNELNVGMLLLTKRPIVLNIDDQEKTYGEADPKYTFSALRAGANTGLAQGDTEDTLQVHLKRAGANIFTSGGGEKVGRYAGSKGIVFDRMDNANYTILDPVDDIYPGAMTIHPFTVEMATAIDSRTSSITITNTAPGNMLPEAAPRFIVRLSAMSGGAVTTLKATEYLGGTAPSLGANFVEIELDPTQDETNLIVKARTASETWGGMNFRLPKMLPAGALVEIVVYDPANNLCAEWVDTGLNTVSASYGIAVGKHSYAAPSVDFIFSDGTSAEYAPPDTVTGRRFVRPGARFQVNQDATAASRGELIEVLYDYVSPTTGAQEQVLTYTTSAYLRRDLSGATYDGVRNPQKITIRYLDGDIANAAVATTFIVNDAMTPLTEDHLALNNRQKKATVTLPAPGTLDSFMVGGTRYPVTKVTDTVYEVVLDWLDDPKNLPLSGAKISAIYTDHLQNKSLSSELTVGRGGPAKSLGGTTNIDVSSVSSIINSDPDNLEIGMASTKGKYKDLILFGTATHYEELVVRVGAYYGRVKVAGSGAYDTTLNTTGTWRIDIDVNKLIKEGYLSEGVTYPITVSYADVNGTPAGLNMRLTGETSGTATSSGGTTGSSGGVGGISSEALEGMFEELDDAVPSLSVFAYPQFIPYGYLIGVTQPYNIIYAVGDNTTQGSADDIGFFCMKVPPESGTFYTVMVADENEEVGYTTFTSGDGGDSSIAAYPLGIMMLDVDDMGDAVAYPATPLMEDILAPGETVTMSLLLGNVLRVGTVEVSRNDNDEITVNAALSDSLSSYGMDGVYLTMFDGAPDPLKMGSDSGATYELNEKIPVGGMQPWMMLEIELPVEALEHFDGMVSFNNPDDADAVLYRKMAYYY